MKYIVWLKDNWLLSYRFLYAYYAHVFSKII